MNSLSIAIIIIIGFQVASYRNCASLTRCKRLSSYWFSTSVILKLRLGAVHKGRPQRRGGGLVKCEHMRTGGGVMKRGHFLRTFFMDDPLMNALSVIFLCDRALLVTRIRGHPFMTSTKKSCF